jgi:cysteine desulfurase
MPILNLDHNATTPLCDAAADAMHRVHTESPGNAASAHALGRRARQFLEDARERVAARLVCKPEEVTFTSGATEANNLALLGVSTATPGHILTSPMEHPCVLEPLAKMAARGWAVEWLPVQRDGTIAPHDIAARVRPDTARIVLQRANHETGVLFDVTAVAALGVSVHCDAAQAVGKVPVSFRQSNATTLSLSAHKFHGPAGVGALIVKLGTPLQATMFGGHQQRGLRPGTEPVALAAGLAAALDSTLETMEADTARVAAQRQRLFEGLAARVPPVIWNGHGAGLLPNTLNASFPGCRNDLLLMALDLAGVACSTGSACSSGSLLPSPVLRAMHVDDATLRSAMRFSLGRHTDAEIDAAIEIIAKCVRRLRSSP